MLSIGWWKVFLFSTFFGSSGEFFKIQNFGWWKNVDFAGILDTKWRMREKVRKVAHFY